MKEARQVAVHGRATPAGCVAAAQA
jgi:hypothetical protein